MRAWLGRMLFFAGRRREALSVLERAGSDASRFGARHVADLVERARRWDPLEQLSKTVEGFDSAPRPGEAARLCSLAALQAASRGDAAAARILCARHADLVATPGYALERTIASLVRARLAALAGNADLSEQEGLEAEREAAGEGVDFDLVAALRSWCEGRPAAASAAGTAAPAADAEIVLDRRSHELRSASFYVSFAARPVLRRLLYALARRKNDVVDKETLASEVWSVEYHPLRHDAPLWSNVHRLRRLIGESGLRIDVDEAGYRLAAPPGFVDAS